jgi:hypothetical protein
MKNLADLGAAAVGVASRVRGERAIHAKGRGYTATLRVLPTAGWLGVPLSDGPDERRAELRLSRAIGLPDAVPDVLGFALRIHDADGQGGVQDLLLASSGRRPVLRHALAPRRDPLHTPYTSITPFEVGGRRLVVAAFPRSSGPTGRLDGAWFDLATAPVSGDWTTFGELHVGMPLSDAAGDEIGFDVANDAGGFRADPVFRRLRAVAYPAARAPEHS